MHNIYTFTQNRMLTEIPEQEIMQAVRAAAEMVGVDEFVRSLTAAAEIASEALQEAA